MSEKMSAAEIARLLEAVNEAMRDGGAPNALFVSRAFYRDLLISHAALQREADGLREALERIAAGDGVYGAQAHEYKQIARAALNGPPQERAKGGSDAEHS